MRIVFLWLAQILAIKY